MLQIRRYQSQDNEIIKELHYAGLRQMGIFREADPYYDNDINNIEEVYLENHGDFLVGEEGDELVVMGGIRKKAEDKGEIKRIRVRHDCQRRGYAEAILLKLLERAKELVYRELCLDCLVSNLPARKLFAKHGFRETHRGKVDVYDLLFYDKTLEC